MCDGYYRCLQKAAGVENKKLSRSFQLPVRYEWAIVEDTIVHFDIFTTCEVLEFLNDRPVYLLADILEPEDCAKF